jgi:hypothetical protein
MKLKLGIFVVAVLGLIGCGEMEGTWEMAEEAPKFGFSGFIEGKEVQMKEVLGDSFLLALNDTSTLKVKVESKGEGERLTVGDFSFSYQKAIKYKRYYYLHQRVDSLTNTVLVVGRYFNRYYGFENILQQNYEVLEVLKDSIQTDKTEEMSSLMIDSLSSKNCIVNPSKKKVIKQFYKNYFGGSYLPAIDEEVLESKKKDEKSLDEIEIEEGEAVNVYPNPVSNGGVTVSSDLLGVNGCKVFVNSMDGKELYSKKVKNPGDLKIDVSNFDSGTYVLTIELPSQKATRKFIVH